MADRSRIEWTDATWNPVTGCSKVSAGCAHCYAERLDRRFRPDWRPWTAANAPHNVRLHPERLDEPLRWRKPRRVFVNSMSDLFHELVPDEFIARVFNTMAHATQHVFQILTKRPERMADWFRSVQGYRYEDGSVLHLGPGDIVVGYREWPLPNVWLGASVENQQAADERIPLLLQTPAAVRFVSCEPLLGPVDLSAFPPFCWKSLEPEVQEHLRSVYGDRLPEDSLNARIARMRIDWVIVGGESGPSARPMHPDWARSLRDQCQQARVPFFFKQWGGWAPLPDGSGVYPGDICLSPDGFWDVAGDDYVCFANESEGTVMRRVGKAKAGRFLDGRTWDEMPGVAAVVSAP